MIDDPPRLASFLALMDFSAEAIALALNERCGVPGPEALELADQATALHESHRAQRDEVLRQHYADAIRAEHEE